jgi:outer membrane protein assembly factor BamB
MRRCRFAFAVTALPLLVLTSCDWTAFRFGPGRSGHNGDETIIGARNVGQLVKRWSLDTASIAGGPLLIGDPVVARGTVYVPANTTDVMGTSVLYARDARTGAAKWSRAFEADLNGRGQRSLSAPAVGNGLVYVGDIGVSGAGFGTIYGGSVRGYDVGTGATTWNSSFFAGGVSGPALANDLVYATSSFNTFFLGPFNGLVASNAGPSGQAEFTGPGGGATRPVSAPAVVSGVVYIGSEGGNLDAVDAAGVTNCTPAPAAAPSWWPRRACSALWSTPTGGPISSTPAVSHGVVYFGSDDTRLYAVAAGGCGTSTCAPLWTGATGGAVRSSPAVANGVVYVGSDDGRIYAFAAGGCGATTCTPLWTAATGGAINSSPAEANGVVYVGSDDGRIYAFRSAGCGAATCLPRWSYATGAAVKSSPAVAHGMVYVGSDDGRLYAFGLPQ